MHKILIAALAALAAGSAHAATFKTPVSWNCEHRGINEYIRMQFMSLPNGAVDGQTEQQSDGGELVVAPVDAGYELRGTVVQIFVVEPQSGARRNLFAIHYVKDRAWVAKLAPPFSTSKLNINCEADQ